MGYKTGQLDTGQMNAFGRLGISGSDFEKKSASDILKKLSAAADRMDPQLFSTLVNQIGLPQSVKYLLQNGSSQVNDLIDQFKGNADELEAAAKQTEDLQASLAKLSDNLMTALIPVLQQIVPLLTDLSGYMATLAGQKQNATNAAKGAIVGAAGGFVAGGPWGAAAGALIGGAAGYNLPTDGTSMATPSSDPNWARNQRNSVDAFVSGRGGGSRHSQVMGYLTGNGLRHDQALGITGALHAESKLDENARNRKSGAFGIGQWLGSRQAELFHRYGRNPTLTQQLEFLMWELRGGDHGGRAVLSQGDAHSTAGAMIRRFLRPAQGFETFRDMSAAGRYISGHRSSAVTINGGVHVTTPSHNGHQIARDIHAGLRRRMQVAQADPVVRS
jgi:hypothetical protein